MGDSTTHMHRRSDALLRRADELRGAGDFPAAVTVLEQLCVTDPSYVPGWAQLAAFRAVTGNHAGALAAAREALSRDPDHLAAHINAGIAAFELDQLETAQRHLERAADIAPDNPVAHLHLARVLERTGKAGPAIDAYVRAISKAPGSSAQYNRIIDHCVSGLAAIDPPAMLEVPTRSVHHAACALADGKLARAHALLERARDGPMGLGAATARDAARVLFARLWHMHARMHSTPANAGPPAPIIFL